MLCCWYWCCWWYDFICFQGMSHDIRRGEYEYLTSNTKRVQQIDHRSVLYTWHLCLMWSFLQWPNTTTPHVQLRELFFHGWWKMRIWFYLFASDLCGLIIRVVWWSCWAYAVLILYSPTRRPSTIIQRASTFSSLSSSSSLSWSIVIPCLWPSVNHAWGVLLLKLLDEIRKRKFHPNL